MDVAEEAGPDKNNQGSNFDGMNGNSSSSSSNSSSSSSSSSRSSRNGSSTIRRKKGIKTPTKTEPQEEDGDVEADNYEDCRLELRSHNLVNTASHINIHTNKHICILM